MGKDLRIWGLGLVVAASMACSAQAAPVLITGSLVFASPDFPTHPNFFNPANGYVPAGSANSSGTTVAITPATEFTYVDVANADGADFSGNTLTIADFTTNGAYPFIMKFSSNSAHFFDNAVLTSDSFGGSISVSGNTLTFKSPNLISTGAMIRLASISFDGTPLGTPEPATWAMMIVGFGLVGAAMRRSRKVTTRVAYAF